MSVSQRAACPHPAVVIGDIPRLDVAECAVTACDVSGGRADLVQVAHE